MDRGAWRAAIHGVTERVGQDFSTKQAVLGQVGLGLEISHLHHLVLSLLGPSVEELLASPVYLNF